MKILLLSIFVLSIFNSSHTQERNKSDFFLSHKKFDYASINLFVENDNLTNKLYRKGFFISSVNTFIPITTGILLLTMTNDNQNQLRKAGRLLFGYGMLLGPSTGHFYLHNAKRGITGLLIRSSATLLITGAVIGAALNGLCENNCRSDEEITRNFLIIAIPSTALISWSIIKGFLSLKDSAKELHDNRLGFLLKSGKDFKSLQIQLSYSF